MCLSILLRRLLQRSQGVALFSEARICNICKYAVIASWPEYQFISPSSETEQDTLLKFSDRGDFIKRERKAQQCHSMSIDP